MIMKKERPNSHENPGKLEDVLLQIQKLNIDQLAIIEGNYSPNDSKRLFIYLLNEENLEFVFNTWIAANDFTILCNSYPKKCFGGCDAMYHGQPKYIWLLNEENKEFLIWRRNKLHVKSNREQIIIFKIFGHQTLLAKDISYIKRTLSKSWIFSGLSIYLKNKKKYLLMTKFSAGPIIDATYDGIDLLYDACWTGEPAKILSNLILVPLIKDEDL